MGSFLAFSMMGTFPVPGQDVYLLTAPFFREVEVTSAVTGRTARIRSEMDVGEGEWEEGEVWYVKYRTQFAPFSLCRGCGWCSGALPAPAVGQSQTLQHPRDPSANLSF